LAYLALHVLPKVRSYEAFFGAESMQIRDFENYALEGRPFVDANKQLNFKVPEGLPYGSREKDHIIQVPEGRPFGSREKIT
jgi:hypothetical protein